MSIEISKSICVNQKNPVIGCETMYILNEIVKTKKTHVCGSNEWKIVRTGADLKLECCGCGRIIMMSKSELDKKVKISK